VTPEDRETLWAAQHCVRLMVTQVFDRLGGTDDPDARRMVLDLTNWLSDLLDSPDGLEFARWEMELDR
jgi:hypothetical protein